MLPMRLCRGKPGRQRVKVAVMGDLILDEYLEGIVARISQKHQ